MHLSILLLTIGYVYGVIIHENVIFHKENEITTTRARWLVSFVQDLSPLKYFLQGIAADIELASNITDEILGHYDGPKQESFRETLSGLREEVFDLKRTLAGIFQSYSDYRALGSRSRRSLIPAIGRVMSFLFGTLDENDIKDVRRGINDLSKNQQSIIHVLEEQMTILNVSRVQISENRKEIIDLVKCVSLFDQRLRNLTVEFNKRIERLEFAVNIYTQMDLLLSGIKDALQCAVLYLENLRLELNMLSLDHLSPSSVVPHQLKSLLIQIKTKLPPTLKLPEDPEKNIWYYYRVLTCSTILDGDQILIILNIPLLDYKGEFDVFRVHSIAVPASKDLRKSSGLPDMAAKYDVEYSGLLINKERSRYALLDADELRICGNLALKYCSPKNAVLPVNLHKLCMLAHFYKDDKKVEKYCRKIVKPNAVLPTAQYISSGHWVVSSRKFLKFSIVYLASKGRKSPMRQQTRTMISFVDIITLESGCHAANDYINLPPYYEFEGYRITSYDPLNKLLEIRNQSKVRIWDPLIENSPNFTKIELPQNLRAIGQIPMDDLVQQLKGLGHVNVKGNSVPNWVYIIVNLALLVVVVALICFCYKRCKSRQKWTPACTCLHCVTSLCEMEGGTNEGEPNRRHESAGVDDELAMSTLLKSDEPLACRQQPNQDEVQPNILEKLQLSAPRRKTKCSLVKE